MKKLAVLGHPVAHSRSPAMQNAALEKLGLGGEWSYEAIEVAAEDFEDRVRAMPGDGFVGANVTIPHKVAALGIADTRSAEASQIGAANTLTFAGGGVSADNTDAYGLLAALPSRPAGRRALVLGAGGSARAVAWALVGQGAEVEVWNRTAERAELVVDGLEPPDSGAPGTLTAVDKLSEGGYELIVNCTAVGMAGEDPFEELPLEHGFLGPKLTLVDLVYGGAETRLVAAAREAGAATVDGLEVLVRQGAASLRIWLSHENEGADVTGEVLDAMREVARAG